jgi:hypothetical protein
MACPCRTTHPGSDKLNVVNRPAVRHPVNAKHQAMETNRIRDRASKTAWRLGESKKLIIESFGVASRWLPSGEKELNPIARLVEFFSTASGWISTWPGFREFGDAVYLSESLWRADFLGSAVLAKHQPRQVVSGRGSQVVAHIRCCGGWSFGYSPFGLRPRGAGKDAMPPSLAGADAHRLSLAVRRARARKPPARLTPPVPANAQLTRSADSD